MTSFWWHSADIKIPAVLTTTSLTRQVVYYQRTVETRSRNHYCRGNAVNCVCSLAVVIQRANRVFPLSYYIVMYCCLALPYIAALALPYIATLAHKRHDFREKK